jgi:AAA domain, putative AbiEii toxin, Type IV TA system
VGALLDASAVPGGRTARNHLRAIAAGNGIGGRRVEEVLGTVGLGSAAGKRVRGFSLGMRQRLGIAAALLGDPPVLLFDEPVNGLDPEGIQWIRGLFKQLAAEGRTVFVSSHLMSEMTLTAGHLVVIGRGRLVADAPVAELILRRQASGLAPGPKPPTPARSTDRGLTVDDARCEAVPATGTQRPETPGAGKVAEATVHPSPDHPRPAARPHRRARPAGVISRPVAPTGLPPATGKTMEVHHVPASAALSARGRDRPPGGARCGVSPRAGMEPTLQRHRAVRGHWRVASRRAGHPAALTGHHEGARPAGPGCRGWRPHSSGGARRAQRGAGQLPHLLPACASPGR